MPPGLPMFGRGMPGLGRGAVPLALMPRGPAPPGVNAERKAKAPRGASAAAARVPAALGPGAGGPVYPEAPGGAFRPAPGIFGQHGWGGPSQPSIMSSAPMMPGVGLPLNHNIEVSNLYDQWLDLSTRPTLAWCMLPPGSVIEAATHDFSNVVDGTALCMIKEKYLSLLFDLKQKGQSPGRTM